MDSLVYIFRFLYRIRYWLIICPIAVALVIYWNTRHMSRQYEVKTTIYTGVMSGYDIETGSGARQDMQKLNNAMDNLMNIITAQTTLNNVSLRLYAQHMMYGDPEKDNNYISASHYRDIYARTPQDVRGLIDKESEERTVENLRNYERASTKNFVYGLFHWTHRHYSYEALSRITVRRLGNSDMLEVRYTTDDPGIAYNTLVLLNEEFIKQYEDLRFGETNNVIAYFEAELARIGKQLRVAEDSLTQYNVEKRVINYEEQTKHVTSLSRDFELRYQDILLEYTSSGEMLAQLEDRIEEHVRNLKDNSIFVSKLKSISDLTSRIAALESFRSDSLGYEPESLRTLRRQLAEAESDFSEFSQEKSSRQYTKEGLSTATIVSQWLEELIRYEKAKAELEVMQQRRKELDRQYVYFSPIGSTINRKKREISFTEQSYLSILQSLNYARLRQKNLQMTSATLKIINPPTYPLAAMPTKRKLMVFGGFVGALVFVLGIFFLLELLDRTLRDKMRTERITGGKVIGASPRKEFRYRAYGKAAVEKSMQHLGNAVLEYCKPTGTSIVNILGTQDKAGKSFVAENLAEYFRRLGLKVTVLSWEKDFSSDDKRVLLARSISDFYTPQGEDIILVEHKSLQDASVPAALLEEAVLNLVTARADGVWKDTDQMLYNRLAKMSADTPLFIFLTRSDRNVVENFTGLLPPYSYLRKLGYRLYQFGFTSSGQ